MQQLVSIDLDEKLIITAHNDEILCKKNFPSTSKLENLPILFNMAANNKDK